VFNGTRWSNSSSHNPGKIPKILHSSYKSLLHPNPNTRLMVSAFLEAQKMPNGYFNNHFLKHVEFLDSYSVQNPVDKETFFSWIASHGLESYPTPFRLYKLIPIIAHAIEFGIGKKQLSVI
jgi:SCY1-like protein 1